MRKGGYIYIMINEHRTTLYVGVTSELERRVQEHRTNFHKHSFTTKYNLRKCVYYEYFLDIEQAIEREKQLKKWSRSKNLIV
ncbi:MAG: GIY-YIG nuclease family protein [Bacteroidales bacterium]|nr:GIY-YIG nuclease family protein [Bacteroidales bacterium]